MSSLYNMATAAPSLDAVVGELRGELAQIPAVEAVCFAHGEASLYVWVGIRTDNDAAWQALGDSEEKLSKAHPDVIFDFRVIPLSPGRRLEDYVSIGQQIFRRVA